MLFLLDALLGKLVSPVLSVLPNSLQPKIGIMYEESASKKTSEPILKHLTYSDIRISKNSLASDVVFAGMSTENKAHDTLKTNNAETRSVTLVELDTPKSPFGESNLDLTSCCHLR